MSWRPTIGLEVHCELKTRTKMFCSCANDPKEGRPNTNICPVCMAHPGSLPVINKQAVAHVLRVGAALGGVIPDYTEFDRKNYFYPDIPKGYQISQLIYPLVSGGALDGVQITRVHLEEDTARSQHEGDKTRIDYNRAGVPLMELVTEPVIHDAKTAGSFARELQLLLRTLGASDANMEEGQMRVEANISVSRDDTFGVKVEIKNLNSFRSVEQAIAYEVSRQIEVLEGGGTLTQETRGWDENKGVTFAQRKKESSHDYRYFPDPDLPKLRLREISEFSRDTIEQGLPELPWKKRERYLALGLKKDDADMFVREQVLGPFFDATIAAGTSATVLPAANYLASDIAGKLQTGELTAQWFSKENAARFAEVLLMVNMNELSSRGAKDLLGKMGQDERSVREIAESEGLLQKSDEGSLEIIVKEVIEANPSVALDYKAGKEAALQFLIGQGMKASKGSANPAVLKEIFKKHLL